MKPHVSAWVAFSIASLVASSALAQQPEDVSVAPRQEPAGTDWQLVGGVASLVTGAGFVGLFNIAFVEASGLRSDPRFEQYKVGRSGDVCEQAAARATAEDQYADGICSRASTLEVLQVVSIPASILAITGGVFLIARRGGSEPEPPVSVDARIGPGAARLEVVGRF